MTDIATRMIRVSHMPVIYVYDKGLDPDLILHQ